MKIKKLTIETSDLKGTLNFYENILGLELLEQTASAITFRAGYTLLSFIYSDKTNPFYHFAFCIPTNKVEEAHAYMAERVNILPFNSETTIANFSNWNAHAFYFHDNQGNIVEFIAHHDLDNYLAEPFTSAAITGICEIGIPVLNVTATCKQLNEQFNIPYYLKGPRLQDFAVMGDEHGLFIVTKAGRGWLPTLRPAEKYRTTIVFENKDEEATLEIE